MRVYLVADSGHKTAFKITTSRVLTNLDYVFFKRCRKYSTDYFWMEDLNIKERLLSSSYIDKIYYHELDDIENVAKKLPDSMWEELAKDFIGRNSEKIQEFQRIREENATKYKEKINNNDI